MFKFLAAKLDQQIFCEIINTVTVSNFGRIVPIRYNVVSSRKQSKFPKTDKHSNPNETKALQIQAGEGAKQGSEDPEVIPFEEKVSRGDEVQLTPPTFERKDVSHRTVDKSSANGQDFLLRSKGLDFPRSTRKSKECLDDLIKTSHKRGCLPVPDKLRNQRYQHPSNLLQPVQFAKPTFLSTRRLSEGYCVHNVSFSTISARIGYSFHTSNDLRHKYMQIKSSEKPRSIFLHAAAFSSALAKLSAGVLLLSSLKQVGRTNLRQLVSARQASNFARRQRLADARTMIECSPSPFGAGFTMPMQARYGFDQMYGPSDFRMNLPRGGRVDSFRNRYRHGERDRHFRYTQLQGKRFKRFDQPTGMEFARHGDHFGIQKIRYDNIDRYNGSYDRMRPYEEDVRMRYVRNQMSRPDLGNLNFGQPSGSRHQRHVHNIDRFYGSQQIGMHPLESDVGLSRNHQAYLIKKVRKPSRQTIVYQRRYNPEYEFIPKPYFEHGNQFKINVTAIDRTDKRKYAYHNQIPQKNIKQLYPFDKKYEVRERRYRYPQQSTTTRDQLYSQFDIDRQGRFNDVENLPAARRKGPHGNHMQLRSYDQIGAHQTRYQVKRLQHPYQRVSMKQVPQNGMDYTKIRILSKRPRKKVGYRKSGYIRQLPSRDRHSRNRKIRRMVQGAAPRFNGGQPLGRGGLVKKIWERRRNRKKAKVVKKTAAKPVQIKKGKRRRKSKVSKVDKKKKPLVKQSQDKPHHKPQDKLHVQHQKAPVIPPLILSGKPMLKETMQQETSEVVFKKSAKPAGEPMQVDEMPSVRSMKPDEGDGSWAYKTETTMFTDDAKKHAASLQKVEDKVIQPTVFQNVSEKHTPVIKTIREETVKSHDKETTIKAIQITADSGKKPALQVEEQYEHKVPVTSRDEMKTIKSASPSPEKEMSIKSIKSVHGDTKKQMITGDMKKHFGSVSEKSTYPGIQSPVPVSQSKEKTVKTQIQETSLKVIRPTSTTPSRKLASEEEKLIKKSVPLKSIDASRPTEAVTPAPDVSLKSRKSVYQEKLTRPEVLSGEMEVVKTQTRETSVKIENTVAEPSRKTTLAGVTRTMTSTGKVETTKDVLATVSKEKPAQWFGSAYRGSVKHSAVEAGPSKTSTTKQAPSKKSSMMDSLKSSKLTPPTFRLTQATSQSLRGSYFTTPSRVKTMEVSRRQDGAVETFSNEGWRISGSPSMMTMQSKGTWKPSLPRTGNAVGYPVRPDVDISFVRRPTFSGLEFGVSKSTMRRPPDLDWSVSRSTGASVHFSKIPRRSVGWPYLSSPTLERNYAQSSPRHSVKSDRSRSPPLKLPSSDQISKDPAQIIRKTSLAASPSICVNASKIPMRISAFRSRFMTPSLKWTHSTRPKLDVEYSQRPSYPTPEGKMSKSRSESIAALGWSRINPLQDQLDYTERSSSGWKYLPQTSRRGTALVPSTRSSFGWSEVQRPPHSGIADSALKSPNILPGWSDSGRFAIAGRQEGYIMRSGSSEEHKTRPGLGWRFSAPKVQIGIEDNISGSPMGPPSAVDWTSSPERIGMQQNGLRLGWEYSQRPMYSKVDSFVDLECESPARVGFPGTYISRPSFKTGAVSQPEIGWSGSHRPTHDEMKVEALGERSSPNVGWPGIESPVRLSLEESEQIRPSFEWDLPTKPEDGYPKSTFHVGPEIGVSKHPPGVVPTIPGYKTNLRTSMLDQTDDIFYKERPSSIWSHSPASVYDGQEGDVSESSVRPFLSMDCTEPGFKLTRATMPGLESIGTQRTPYTGMALGVKKSSQEALPSPGWSSIRRPTLVSVQEGYISRPTFGMGHEVRPNIKLSYEGKPFESLSRSPIGTRSNLEWDGTSSPKPPYENIYGKISPTEYNLKPGYVLSESSIGIVPQTDRSKRFVRDYFSMRQPTRPAIEGDSSLTPSRSLPLNVDVSERPVGLMSDLGYQIGSRSFAVEDMAKTRAMQPDFEIHNSIGPDVSWRLSQGPLYNDDVEHISNRHIGFLGSAFELSHLTRPTYSEEAALGISRKPLADLSSRKTADVIDMSDSRRPVFVWDQSRQESSEIYTPHPMGSLSRIKWGDGERGERFDIDRSSTPRTDLGSTYSIKPGLMWKSSQRPLYSGLEFDAYGKYPSSTREIVAEGLNIRKPATRTEFELSDWHTPRHSGMTFESPRSFAQPMSSTKWRSGQQSEGFLKKTVVNRPEMQWDHEVQPTNRWHYQGKPIFTKEDVEESRIPIQFERGMQATTFSKPEFGLSHLSRPKIELNLSQRPLHGELEFDRLRHTILPSIHQSGHRRTTKDGWQTNKYVNTPGFQWRHSQQPDYSAVEIEGLQSSSGKMPNIDRRLAHASVRPQFEELRLYGSRMQSDPMISQRPELGYLSGSQFARTRRPFEVAHGMTWSGSGVPVVEQRTADVMSKIAPRSPPTRSDFQFYYSQQPYYQPDLTIRHPMGSVTSVNWQHDERPVLLSQEESHISRPEINWTHSLRPGLEWDSSQGLNVYDHSGKTISPSINQSSVRSVQTDSKMRDTTARRGAEGSFAQQPLHSRVEFEVPRSFTGTIPSFARRSVQDSGGAWNYSLRPSSEGVFPQRQHNRIELEGSNKAILPSVGWNIDASQMHGYERRPGKWSYSQVPGYSGAAVEIPRSFSGRVPSLDWASGERPVDHRSRETIKYRPELHWDHTVRPIHEWSKPEQDTVWAEAEIPFQDQRRKAISVTPWSRPMKSDLQSDYSQRQSYYDSAAERNWIGPMGSLSRIQWGDGERGERFDIDRSSTARTDLGSTYSIKPGLMWKFSQRPLYSGLEFDAYGKPILQSKDPSSTREIVAEGLNTQEPATRTEFELSDWQTPRHSGVTFELPRTFVQPMSSTKWRSGQQSERFLKKTVVNRPEMQWDSKAQPTNQWRYRGKPIFTGEDVEESRIPIQFERGMQTTTFSKPEFGLSHLSRPKIEWDLSQRPLHGELEFDRLRHTILPSIHQSGHRRTTKDGLQTNKYVNTPGFQWRHSQQPDYSAVEIEGLQSSSGKMPNIDKRLAHASVRPQFEELRLYGSRMQSDPMISQRPELGYLSGSQFARTRRPFEVTHGMTWSGSGVPVVEQRTADVMSKIAPRSPPIRSDFQFYYSQQPYYQPDLTIRHPMGSVTSVNWQHDERPVLLSQEESQISRPEINWTHSLRPGLEWDSPQGLHVYDHSGRTISPSINQSSVRSVQTGSKMRDTTARRGAEWSFAQQPLHSRVEFEVPRSFTGTIPSFARRNVRDSGGDWNYSLRPSSEGVFPQRQHNRIELEGSKKAILPSVGWNIDASQMHGYERRPGKWSYSQVPGYSGAAVEIPRSFSGRVPSLDWASGERPVDHRSRETIKYRPELHWDHTVRPIHEWSKPEQDTVWAEAEIPFQDQRREAISVTPCSPPMKSDLQSDYSQRQSYYDSAAERNWIGPMGSLSRIQWGDGERGERFDIDRSSTARTDLGSTYSIKPGLMWKFSQRPLYSGLEFDAYGKPILQSKDPSSTREIVAEGLNTQEPATRTEFELSDWQTPRHSGVTFELPRTFVQPMSSTKWRSGQQSERFLKKTVVNRPEMQWDSKAQPTNQWRYRGKPIFTGEDVEESRIPIQFERGMQTTTFSKPEFGLSHLSRPKIEWDLSQRPLHGELEFDRLRHTILPSIYQSGHRRTTKDGLQTNKYVNTPGFQWRYSQQPDYSAVKIEGLQSSSGKMPNIDRRVTHASGGPQFEELRLYGSRMQSDPMIGQRPELGYLSGSQFTRTRRPFEVARGITWSGSGLPVVEQRTADVMSTITPRSLPIRQPMGSVTSMNWRHDERPVLLSQQESQISRPEINRTHSLRPGLEWDSSQGPHIYDRFGRTISPNINQSSDRAPATGSKMRGATARRGAEWSFAQQPLHSRVGFEVPRSFTGTIPSFARRSERDSGGLAIDWNYSLRPSSETGFQRRQQHNRIELERSKKAILPRVDWNIDGSQMHGYERRLGKWSYSQAPGYSGAAVEIPRNFSGRVPNLDWTSGERPVDHRSRETIEYRPELHWDHTVRPIYEWSKPEQDTVWAEAEIPFQDQRTEAISVTPWSRPMKSDLQSDYSQRQSYYDSAADRTWIGPPKSMGWYRDEKSIEVDMPGRAITRLSHSLRPGKEWGLTKRPVYGGIQFDGSRHSKFTSDHGRTFGLGGGWQVHEQEIRPGFEWSYIQKPESTEVESRGLTKPMPSNDWKSLQESAGHHSPEFRLNVPEIRVDNITHPRFERSHQTGLPYTDMNVAFLKQPPRTDYGVVESDWRAPAVELQTIDDVRPYIQSSYMQQPSYEHDSTELRPTEPLSGMKWDYGKIPRGIDISRSQTLRSGIDYTHSLRPSLELRPLQSQSPLYSGLEIDDSGRPILRRVGLSHSLSPGLERDHVQAIPSIGWRSGSGSAEFGLRNDVADHPDIQRQLTERSSFTRIGIPTEHGMNWNGATLPEYQRALDKSTAMTKWGPQMRSDFQPASYDNDFVISRSPIRSLVSKDWSLRRPSVLDLQRSAIERPHIGWNQSLRPGLEWEFSKRPSYSGVEFEGTRRSVQPSVQCSSHRETQPESWQMMGHTSRPQIDWSYSSKPGNLGTGSKQPKSLTKNMQSIDWSRRQSSLGSRLREFGQDGSETLRDHTMLPRSDGPHLSNSEYTDMITKVAREQLENEAGIAWRVSGLPVGNDQISVETIPNHQRSGTREPEWKSSNTQKSFYELGSPGIRRAMGSLPSADHVDRLTTTKMAGSRRPEISWADSMGPKLEWAPSHAPLNSEVELHGTRRPILPNIDWSNSRGTSVPHVPIQEKMTQPGFKWSDMQKPGYDGIIKASRSFTETMPNIDWRSEKGLRKSFASQPELQWSHIDKPSASQLSMNARLTSQFNPPMGLDFQTYYSQRPSFECDGTAPRSPIGSLESTDWSHRERYNGLDTQKSIIETPDTRWSHTLRPGLELESLRKPGRDDVSGYLKEALPNMDWSDGKTTSDGWLVHENVTRPGFNWNYSQSPEYDRAEIDDHRYFTGAVPSTGLRHVKDPMGEELRLTKPEMGGGHTLRTRPELIHLNKSQHTGPIRAESDLLWHGSRMKSESTLSQTQHHIWKNNFAWPGASDTRADASWSQPFSSSSESRSTQRPFYIGSVVDSRPAPSGLGWSGSKTVVGDGLQMHEMVKPNSELDLRFSKKPSHMNLDGAYSRSFTGKLSSIDWRSGERPDRANHPEFKWDRIQGSDSEWNGSRRGPTWSARTRKAAIGWEPSLSPGLGWSYSQRQTSSEYPRSHISPKWGHYGRGTTWMDGVVSYSQGKPSREFEADVSRRHAKTYDSTDRASIVRSRLSLSHEADPGLGRSSTQRPLYGEAEFHASRSGAGFGLRRPETALTRATRPLVDWNNVQKPTYSEMRVPSGTFQDVANVDWSGNERFVGDNMRTSETVPSLQRMQISKPSFEWSYLQPPSYAPPKNEQSIHSRTAPASVGWDRSAVSIQHRKTIAPEFMSSQQRRGVSPNRDSSFTGAVPSRKIGRFTVRSVEPNEELRASCPVCPSCPPCPVCPPCPSCPQYSR